MGEMQKANMSGTVTDTGNPFTDGINAAQREIAAGDRTVNIYLDIDGVLIRNGKPTPNCFAFLRWAVANHTPYWLTTRDPHGSHDGILRAFRLAMGAATLPTGIETLLTAIRPTRWRTNKVSAIDVSSDFVWLEDQPLPTEIELLRSLGLLDRLIIINSDDDLLSYMAGRAASRFQASDVALGKASFAQDR